MERLPSLKMMSFNKFTRFLIFPLTLWYINRLTYVTANTCHTKYCREFAKRIVMSMNTSADPCTDFYEYACGSWKLHNPLPEGKVQWSVDDILSENTSKKIRDIVGEPEKKDDIDPVIKMKRFYRSCMDTRKLQKNGLASLINIVNSTGGWPIVEPTPKDENPTTVPWQQIDMTYSNVDGRNAFFSILFTHDDVDLTRHVLLLDDEAPYPLLKNEDDIDEDAETTIMAFAELIGRTVGAIMRYKGITIDEAQFGQDVVDLLMFEFSLHDITGQDTKGTKDDIEKMTIGSLQEWYDSLPHENSTSNINWLELLNVSFELINKTLSPDEPIFVTSKKTLKELSVLLDKTSERTIVNYVQWAFISRYIAFTTKELSDAKYTMYSQVYNTTIEVPRWKECIKQIGMQDIISYVFVRKHFSERGKLEAEDIVDRIKEQIAIGINKSVWTTPDMKTHMIEKLNAVKEQVGYPEWYMNETNIKIDYAKLEITDDFFQNILNYGKYVVSERVKQFFEPIDKNAWLEYPTTVNAFYSERDNIIVIPAAELQEPFFTPHLPDAINYGSVGFIIGHELSHGFDHVGIKYDKHGNIVTKKVEQLLDTYKSKAECFVEEYNQFSFNHTDKNGDAILLNGNLTENENIADSTGIKVAYLAYKQKSNELSRNGVRRRLPLLNNFTEDQLFFLSFATSWCGVTHPKFEKLSINVDVHSPSNFRIIGSLKNMDSFASVFKCQPGSPMNPPEKCTIWS